MRRNAARRVTAARRGTRAGSVPATPGATRGPTARLPCELDPRRFPPIPRATKEFQRPYKGRTAVGRVNARLKILWGADDGKVTGSRRFHAFVGAPMVVHPVFATLPAKAPRREGTPGQTRLGPVAEALRHREPAPAGG